MNDYYLVVVHRNIEGMYSGVNILSGHDVLCSNVVIKTNEVRRLLSII